ncbi:MAG: DivIVA domain-containing protein [bacterium]|nr:DivIVA domain-containing protein [bacterium]
MKLTPLDIRKQTFKKKSMGGSDPSEVQAFLEMVAGEVEELIRENTSLAERLEGLETKVDDYRRMEKTLQDTLLSAQKTSEELRKNAEQRGDLMIKEAQFKADQIIGEARARLMDLQRQIADLKNMRTGYLAKFRSLLDSHLEILQYQEMDSGVRIQTNIFAGSKKEEAPPEAKAPEIPSQPGRAMDEQKMADMQRMLSTLMETAKLTIPEVPQAEEPPQVQTETPTPGEEIK